MTLSVTWPDGHSLKLRPASEPLPDHHWCIEWRTPQMASPAFWYYADKAQARQTYDSMDAEWSERAARVALYNDCLPGAIFRASLPDER